MDVFEGDEPYLWGVSFSRLQTIEQQGGQHFWELFPTVGNDLVAEQLER